MTPRLLKLVLAWNVVLTVLLLLSLAGSAALIQASSDPPVHVYSASMNDHAAGGSATTINDIINTTTPDVLVQVTTGNLSAAHNHVCVVTASAGAVGGQDGIYIFGLNKDAPGSTVPASERKIEMVGATDDDYEEVSTTYAFTGISGSHTFYFSARKSSAGANNLTVDASSITVVCIKKGLTFSESDGSAD